MQCQGWVRKGGRRTDTKTWTRTRTTLSLGLELTIIGIRTGDITRAWTITNAVYLKCIKIIPQLLILFEDENGQYNQFDKEDTTLSIIIETFIKLNPNILNK